MQVTAWKTAACAAVERLIAVDKSSFEIADAILVRRVCLAKKDTWFDTGAAALEIGSPTSRRKNQSIKVDPWHLKSMTAKDGTLSIRISSVFNKNRDLENKEVYVLTFNDHDEPVELAKVVQSLKQGARPEDVPYIVEDEQPFKLPRNMFAPQNG